MTISIQQRVWRIAAHAALGALLGYTVLHVAALVFQHVGLDVHGLHWGLWREAFTLQHLPMGLYFAALGAAFGATVGTYVDRVRSHRERVQVLEGLLPICAHCKRIRDEAQAGQVEGRGVPVEVYVSEHSRAEFSHGLCPDCIRQFYPEDADEILRDDR